MTGQDAVRSAEEFHRRIGITGVVLTRWTAMRVVRGAVDQTGHRTPVKFVGVGEKV